MAELDPRDFRESMDAMCDDAFRRMFAITESGSAAFLGDNDRYFTDISLGSAEGDKLDAVTHLETGICEIHDRLATDPSFVVLEMLARAAFTLERYAMYAGSEATSLSLGSAANDIIGSLEDRLLLSRTAISQRETVALSAYAHSGTFGELGLMLNPIEDDLWQLCYASVRHTYVKRNE